MKNPLRRVLRSNVIDIEMDRIQPERIAGQVIGSAIQVHRVLGPGLLESAYQRCHSHELQNRGLAVRIEVTLPLVYGGLRIDNGYRIDVLVEDCIIVENKVVDALLPVHEAQLLTYLKLSGCRLGFLLNWNVALLKHGIKRMVLGLEE